MDTAVTPDARELLRELLDIWDQQNAAEVQVAREVDAIRHATLVHGLTAHAADLARGVLVLYDAKMFLQMYPLVRLMLEDSILAMWLESEKGSWRELLHKASADLVRLIDEIAEHGALSPGYETLRSQAGAAREQLAEAKRGRLTVERQMVELQGAGKSMYTDYRLLSQWAHAGKPIVDLYTVEDESVVGGIRSSSVPLIDLDSADTNAIVGYGAAAFLQALFVWDRATIEQVGRQHLEIIASRLGVRVERAARTEDTPRSPH